MSVGEPTEEPPRLPESAAEAEHAMQLLAALSKGESLKPENRAFLQEVLGRLPSTQREARRWKIRVKKHWKGLS